MTQRKGWGGLVLATLIGLALVASSCKPAAPVARGAGNTVAAPDFTLAKLDGQSVTLSELKGHPVLVNFWATWCPSCREEMPLLQQAHEDYQKDGLIILAVDIAEKPAIVQKFLNDNKLTFAVVLDRDSRVSSMYGIRLIPTSVLVDKDGNIREVKVGAFANMADIRGSLKKIMP